MEEDFANLKEFVSTLESNIIQKQIEACKNQSIYWQNTEMSKAYRESGKQQAYHDVLCMIKEMKESWWAFQK